MSQNIKQIIRSFQKERYQRQEVRQLYRDRYQNLLGGFKSKSKTEESSNIDIRQQDNHVWIQAYERGGQPLNKQQNQLLLQNKALKDQLLQIQTSERQRIERMNVAIEQIKGQYKYQIQQVLRNAQQSKKASTEKLNKYKELIPTIEAKNRQLENINKSLEEQTKEANVLAGKYATQIKQEYISKINQIETIFQMSEEKIEAFQKAFNEDEFIQNTLRNEDLLKGIEQNASKAAEAENLIGQYNELLEGKTQILNSIRKANQMKEEQLKKMVAVEAKIKAMIDTLHQDKDNIVEQNQQMIHELIEIKQLLTKALQPQQS